MEFEELSSIETKSYVLLCKKCLEKGEYMIPLYEMNVFNEIEYKCSKKHIINKNDVCFGILDGKIKDHLRYCNNQNHIGSNKERIIIFCAWCEECEMNICQIGVHEDMKRGHGYKLYAENIPDDQYEFFVIKKLDKLKSLIDGYKIYYPDAKEDILYLIKTFNRNFMNYNLYYHENIINHQTINNLLFNSKDGFTNEVFEIFEKKLTICRKFSAYKELLGKKSIDNINLIESKNKFNDNDIIIPLVQENKDKNGKNKIYLCVFTETANETRFFIYDSAENIINRESIYKEFQNIHFMKYNNNVIIIYNPSELTIINFSDDYKSHKLFHFHPGDNIFENILGYNQKYKYILGKKFYFVQKLIKTSNNKLMIIDGGKAYSLEIEKFLDKNNSASTAEGKLDKMSSNKNYILNLNTIYYKDNNKILEGLILISFTIDLGINIFNKAEIKMFNENLQKINEIKFNYSFHLHQHNFVLDIFIIM